VPADFVSAIHCARSRGRAGFVVRVLFLHRDGFTAIMGLMIFGFGDSTLDKALHYPRPVVERSVAAANAQRPLFMLAVKDGSPPKNALAKDAKVPDVTSVANVDTEKSKRERPAHPRKLVSRRENHEWHDDTVAQGYNAGFGYRPGLDGQH